MNYPEDQEIFNDLINSIKEGTYEKSELNLSSIGLTNEDVAELCTAIRVATEKNRCHITQLDLSYNQLTTINVKGLTQLKKLFLSGNQLTTINVKELTQLKELNLSFNRFTTINLEELTQLKVLDLSFNWLSTINVEKLLQFKKIVFFTNPLTTLTRTLLFRILPVNTWLGPSVKMIPALEKQMQVNNEFDAKVAWAAQQFFNGNESAAIELALKSELEKDESLLLMPEDSVYVMREASIKIAEQMAENHKTFNKCATDDSFLFYFPSDIKESIIQYMGLDFQVENKNAPALPSVENSYSLKRYTKS